MDRVHQLDTLWKAWKDNFIIANEKRREWDSCITSQSILARSLEMIMEQVFAEINFLKKENGVLREESNGIKSLNSILAENLLENMGKQQENLCTIGVELQSLRKGGTAVVRSNMSGLSRDTKHQSIANGTISNENREIIETSLVKNTDRFSSEATSALREETVEKTKLLSLLTDKLLQTTTRYQDQLRKDQLQLQKIAQRSKTINHINIYDSSKCIDNKNEKYNNSSPIIKPVSCLIKAPILYQDDVGTLIA